MRLPRKQGGQNGGGERHVTDTRGGRGRNAELDLAVRSRYVGCGLSLAVLPHTLYLGDIPVLIYSEHLPLRVDRDYCIISVYRNMKVKKVRNAKQCS